MLAKIKLKSKFNKNFILIGCLIGFGLIIPVQAQAEAKLTFDPQTSQYTIGQTVTAAVVLEANTEVNAVSGTINIDPDNLLTIESFNIEESIIDFWTSSNNGVAGPNLVSSNQIFFEGAITGEPHTGQGQLFTINLKVAEAGSVNLTFKEESSVHKADGQGTKAELIREPANYLLGQVDILPSPTGLFESNIEPTAFTANWQPVNQAERYRLELSLDNFSTILQSQIINAPTTNYRFSNLTPNTLYYWRLRAEANNLGPSNYSSASLTLPADVEEPVDPDPEPTPDPGPTPGPGPTEPSEPSPGIALLPPEVSTLAASSISYNQATLIGALTDLGQAKAVAMAFQWRRSGADRWQTINVTTLNSAGEFRYQLRPLTANTRYQFRVMGQWNDQVVTGQIREFTTTSRPIVATTAQTIRSGAEQIIDNPVGRVTSQTIAAGGAAVGASQIMMLSSGLASMADAYLLFLRLIGAILGWLGLRRRHKPWGTVYDSVTKRPLDPAYVTAHKDSPDGKEVASDITDIDGRFGFLLPAGTYYLKAEKTHYRFPASTLIGQTNDELYDHLYFGGPITTSGEEVLNYNIPMDPVGFDWNEFAKNKQALFEVYSSQEKWRTRIFNFIFVLGFAIAALLVTIAPSWFNLTVFLIYVLIFFWQWLWQTTHKAVSVIGINGQPISFAIIRFYLADLDQEVKHVVTDALGRFYVLIRPGRYYLTVEEKQVDGSYRQIHKSKIFNLDKGVLTNNIKIQ